VQCQLETLRFCRPPNIRHVLNELPKTLDTTYEQTLLRIHKQTWSYTHRLFQCLFISIRPLRVKELAELLAIQPYGDTLLGFNSGWRPEDPEEYILSTCSTLVTIVGSQDEEVVQFSHFSVSEYLTSDRIANSATVSIFHILPRPAHALLARACLGTLFQLDYNINKSNIQNFPLAWYAAEHWVDHARFGDVSSDLREWMDEFFDRNKPHLAAWIWLYDVESRRRRDQISAHPTRLDAVPLYYAVLCGLRDPTEGLLKVHPQDLNARGGHYETPLYAAIDKGHLDITLLLLDRGADVESRGPLGQTALYKASSCGYAKALQLLIDHAADLNAECDDKDDLRGVKWTALHVATKKRRLDIARVLVEHSADLNHQDNFGRSPLQIASRHWSTDLVQLFLDCGANPNASDIWGMTALHEASIKGETTVVMSLLRSGANVHAQDKSGLTPLYYARRVGRKEVMRLLLDHGADANTQLEMNERHSLTCMSSTQPLPQTAVWTNVLPACNLPALFSFFAHCPPILCTLLYYFITIWLQRLRSLLRQGGNSDPTGRVRPPDDIKGGPREDQAKGTTPQRQALLVGICYKHGEQDLWETLDGTHTDVDRFRELLIGAYPSQSVCGRHSSRY
jgi:ankyrin repeat protein